MKHKIIFILIFIGFNTLATPDSTIDFKASINSEEKIAEGIYRITHKAPRLLFSATRSWKGLNKRAESLCGRKDYLLIDKKQIIVGYITEISQEEFLVEAHAICDPNKISESDAKNIIDKFYSPPITIDEETVKNCVDGHISTKELAHEETLKLLKIERYSEARQCLENIISVNDNSQINKLAYFQLGFMYEIGRGIEPNQEKSLMYYQFSN